MIETPDQTKGRFRSAMSNLVAGVAAITVGNDNTPRGLLATSVSSFSDQPPSVVVSLSHHSRTLGPLLRAESFGVHLLGRDQADVAKALAGSAVDKFAGLSWVWDEGVPRLPSALGFLRCRRSASFDCHDHTILIGDVEFVDLGDSAPLVYFRQSLNWSLSQPI